MARATVPFYSSLTYLTKRYHAQYVLDRLLAFNYEEDDERWMLLDTDHCTQANHFSNFILAIREARQREVNVALSKPCFELWLLLHHVEESNVASLANARETESALRATLGQYNKTALRQEHFPVTSPDTHPAD